MEQEFKPVAVKNCASTHEGEVFAFCKTDNTYICEQCYQREHRGHVVEQLKFIAKDHLGSLKSLEASIASTLSTCMNAQRAFNRPLIMRKIKDQITEYYEGLINALKESCATKIASVNSSLAPTFAIMERMNRTLELQREDLTFLLTQTRQQQKNCENSLVTNKFRHFHTSLAKLTESQRKVRIATQTIENTQKNLSLTVPVVKFKANHKDICAKIAEGIVAQNRDPEEIPEEEAEMNPTIYTEKKVEKLQESDTIRLFQVLNDSPVLYKQEATPEVKPKPKKHIRSKTPDGIKPRAGIIKKKAYPTTLKKRPAQNKEKRIFYIEPIGKLLHSYFLNTKETRVIPLNFDKSLPEGFGATELHNGQIFLSGGERNKLIIANTYEIYESVKALVERKHMIYSRRNHGFITIRNLAVSIGGYNKASMVLKKCEKFDPSENIWQELPELNEERNFLSPCVVSEKYLYVLGGLCDNKGETYEYLDIETPIEWVKVQVVDNTKARKGLGFGMGSIQISQNEILVFGGLNEKEYFNSSYVLNIETGILATTGTALKVKDAFYQRQPVMAGNFVYSYGYWSKCLHIFNIDTFEWNSIILS